MNTRQRLYAYLLDYIAANGYAPTLREMDLALNVRRVGARHLPMLVKLGLIERTPHKWRGIKLLRRAS